MAQFLLVTGRAVRGHLGNTLRNRRTPSLITGMALGIAGWSAIHPFVAALGFNRETVAGLLIALAASLAGGFHLARRCPHWSESRLPEVVAAAWIVLLPFVLAAVLPCVTAIPVNWLVRPAVCGMAVCATGLAVLGLPMACIGLISDRYRRQGTGTTLLAGAGLGIAANALFLAPTIGLQVPLLAIAVLAAIGWFVRMITGRARHQAPSTAEAPLTRSELDSRILTSAFAVLVGAAGVVCCRALAQLMLESSALVAFGIAVFLTGVPIGVTFGNRLGRRFGNSAIANCIAGALTAGTLFSLLAAFPWLVHRHLDANAFVSSVFWLSVARFGTVSGFAVPLGVSCGLACGLQRSAGAIAVSLAGGFVVGSWLLPIVGLVPLALTIGSGAVVVAASAGVSRFPKTRVACVSGLACAAWLIVTGAGVGRYMPERAAALLFNTETFLARQGGTPQKLLPFLSETRLLSSRESSVGTVTIWRRRGESSVMRIDGVPVAATGRRPDWCPLPSADVMRMALPLLLHQDAESVLVLGDPAGVATMTAARFPVREITMFDSVSGASETDPGRTRDERIAALTLEPRLALSAQSRQFDVIVSDPGTPSVPSATPYFTQEFYAAAAATLAADGIFCQRLRYADYGAEPLRIIAATIQREFGEVMTIEIGSGDYALLGTRRGQSLVRDGLLDRLKRPHARRVLASLGWDWCVPLNLTSVENEGMTLLADEARGRNNDANGLLAYTLPQETMRWGPKSRELQTATVGKTSRLAMRGVPAEEQEDVLARIADVTQQQRLMTAFPDQPWAYRKDVRTQLAEKPRGVIRPVAGEVLRERHPVDRRRIAYFEALGRAIHEPTSENLGKLALFSDPYDPLITYFLHHEIAPLYSDLGDAGEAQELAHRFYTAYYANPRDRSVRDIAATLELLIENQSLIDDEVERFDHFNGLLEVLLDRWESRGLAEPRSPEVVMIDIDISLDAVEATLEAMEPLAVSAGMTPEEWSLRQAAVERVLTRPLRKYRTSLLPHLRAAQRNVDDSSDEVSDATSSEVDLPASSDISADGTEAVPVE